MEQITNVDQDSFDAEESTYYQEEQPTFSCTINNELVTLKAKLNQWGIIKNIGQGATYQVKLGIHMQTGLKVAIKIFNDNIGDEIKNEIAALSLLQNCPNVV